MHMTDKSRHEKVVVVGAGINGLVAAYYLQRAGFPVTLLERADRVGGACVAEVAVVNGQSQSYALGASVLGLMPAFIFNETGLSKRLKTFAPTHPKLVYFPGHDSGTWIYREPAKFQRELAEKWDENGDIEAFRADEARVVSFLQAGYRAAVPPTLAEATRELGHILTRLWITGSAQDLLDHYFTADFTKLYMAMTVTESGPVSLKAPYSAFTLPLMDSGSVFDGHYGFVNPGIWKITEELGRINADLGVNIHLASQVEAIASDEGRLDYRDAGQTHSLTFDHLVFATDPLTAARLIGDEQHIAAVANKRFLGSSGKLTLLFEQPVRWRETSDAPHADAAFRFIFSIDSLADFERATLRVTGGEVDYEPGYVQIYTEGGALRQMGLVEPFDRLALFFKNMAFDKRGEALPEVKQAVKELVLSHIDNPEDCVWSRMLAPKDLQHLFHFPEGNLDHTMLIGGQTFANRQFSADPENNFYAFGRQPHTYYCGAGAYPCGSIAGTPGYMCAQQLIRQAEPREN